MLSDECAVIVLIVNVLLQVSIKFHTVIKSKPLWEDTGNMTVEYANKFCRQIV